MTEERRTSWWQTLPGILTATATVITAVTGLVVVLAQLGVFSGDVKPPASDAAQTQAAKASESKAADPAVTTTAGDRPFRDSKAYIALKDGSTLTLDASTFRNCISVGEGMNVNSLDYRFDQMRSIEVLEANSPLAPGAQATVRLSLRDGKVVDGKTQANCGMFGYSGENRSRDLNFNEIKRIDFR